VLRPSHDPPPATENDKLTQALTAKGLETVQFMESLLANPEDALARSGLVRHLDGLMHAVAQLGFVHLEAAISEATARLEREAFSPAALSAVERLAGRYAALAAMPTSRSGTHPVVPEASEPSRGHSTLEGRRVLVAIDEAPVRWSYVGILREAGARVTEARDGMEALELARRNRPDVILADMAMPRLDGLGLWAAVRREHLLDAVPVVLLSASLDEPPRALTEAGTGSSAVLDALLDVLARQGAIEAAFAGSSVAPEQTPTPKPRAGVGGGLIPPEVERESPLMTDPLERENIRAQSAVAMHREPANRAPRWSYPIWRMNLGTGTAAGSLSSGFDVELQVFSRVLGLGFIALLAGTVAVLAWSQWVSTVRGPASIGPASVEARRVEPVEPVVIEVPVERPPASEGEAGLTAFSGELRPGVDTALGVGEGQGVLELTGPSEVTVDIDGVDHGSLPVEVVLDQGRHTVRYRFGDRSTYRFYTVKPGATRALQVIAQPGGLIDAR